MQSGTPIKILLMEKLFLPPPRLPKIHYWKLLRVSEKWQYFLPINGGKYSLALNSTPIIYRHTAVQALMGPASNANDEPLMIYVSIKLLVTRIWRREKWQFAFFSVLENGRCFLGGRGLPLISVELELQKQVSSKIFSPSNYWSRSFKTGSFSKTLVLVNVSGTLENTSSYSENPNHRVVIGMHFLPQNT